MRLLAGLAVLAILRKIRTAGVGVAALALYAGVSWAHFFVVAPIANPVSVVTETEAQVSSSSATWVCQTKGGAVLDGPWSDLAAAQNACGAIAAGDGSTLDVAERVVESISSQRVTTTARYEIRGSTALRVSEAGAAPPVVSGGPGGTGTAPAPAGPNTHPEWTSLSNLSIEINQAYCLDLNDVGTDANGDARIFTSAGDVDGMSLAGPNYCGTPTILGDTTVTFGQDDGRQTQIAAAIVTVTPALFTSTLLSQLLTDLARVEFPVAPTTGTLDWVCGFGPEPATGVAQFWAAVRANPSGNWDVRDNDNYYADATVAAGAGTMRFDFDFLDDSYEVSFNAAGDPDTWTVVRTDAQFRSNQTASAFLYAHCFDAFNRPVGSSGGPFARVQPIRRAINVNVFTADMMPPATPAAPTLSSVSTDSIEWSLATPPDADFSHHIVERSLDGSMWTEIEPHLVALFYTDSGLSPSTGYWYRVTAVDLSGNPSSPSTALMAATTGVDVDALLSTGNVSITEGNTAVDVALTLSSPQAFDTKCRARSVGGTATPPADYTALDTEITIPSGMPSASVALSILEDATEESSETVNVVFDRCGEGAQSSSTTEHVAVVTILDDDTSISDTGCDCTGPVCGAGSGSVTEGAFTHTYDWDGTRQCGYFNDRKSLWVVAPSGLTLTNITGTATIHGAEINPRDPDDQGFLSSYSSYDAALNVLLQLPKSVPTDSSVVTVSGGVVDGVNDCFRSSQSAGKKCAFAYTALTVLPAAPSNNGATAFRPAFAETGGKTVYYESDFDFTRLPSEALIANSSAQTAFTSVKKWSSLIMDYAVTGIGDQGRDFVAVEFYNDYGRDIAQEWHQHVLSVFGNEALAGDKRDAVNALLQAGLDTYHGWKEGITYPSGAGQNVGKYPRILFFAALTTATAIQADVQTIPSMHVDEFQETGQIEIYPLRGNVPIWGDLRGESGIYLETASTCNEKGYWADYWQYQSGGGVAKKTCADYYGYVDGPAEKAGGYTSPSGGGNYLQQMSGGYAALRLQFAIWPELAAQAPSLPLVDWIDTHYNPTTKIVTGDISQDVCAGPPSNEVAYPTCNPYNAAGEAGCDFYKVAWGPDPGNPGMCILGSNNRYEPPWDVGSGTATARSDLADAVWSNYLP